MCRSIYIVTLQHFDQYSYTRSKQNYLIGVVTL